MLVLSLIGLLLFGFACLWGFGFLMLVLNYALGKTHDDMKELRKALFLKADL